MVTADICAILAKACRPSITARIFRWRYFHRSSIASSSRVIRAVMCSTSCRVSAAWLPCAFHRKVLSALPPIPRYFTVQGLPPPAVRRSDMPQQKFTEPDAARAVDLLGRFGARTAKSGSASCSASGTHTAVNSRLDNSAPASTNTRSVFTAISSFHRQQVGVTPRTPPSPLRHAYKTYPVGHAS